MSIASDIQQLKNDIERARGLRADAASAQKLAIKQLEEIDKALKELGIDPENADVSVAALETKLQADIAAAQVAVADEIAKLSAITTAARAAGLL